MSNVETCFSCGATTPVSKTGATHRYMLSSPGCWEVFGEILNREYSDMNYWKVHELTVDAYAIQHIGEESKQTINSLNVHLLSLYGYFKGGKDIHQLHSIKQGAAQSRQGFKWLERPDNFGPYTVEDVIKAESAEEHKEIVEKWAEGAFSAWFNKHGAHIEWLYNLMNA